MQYELVQAYHAMLKEGGMKRLQNSFVAAKPSPMSTYAGEGASDLALQNGNRS